MKVLLSLVLVGLLTAVCCSSARVSAQEPEIELSVSPAIIDAPAAAGERVEKTLQITNRSLQALPISIEPQAAIIEGTLIEDRVITRFDVSEWIDVSSDTEIYAPGETKKLTFSVTVPFSAAAGGYYAQLSLRSLALESPNQISAGLVFPEITVPVLVTVPGEINEQISLPDDSHIFPFYANQAIGQVVDIRVHNTGNVHNLVTPQVKLKKRHSDYEITVPLQAAVLLPGTERVFSFPLPELASGRYDVRLHLTGGSRSQQVVSTAESLLVGPSLSRILQTGLIVWAVAFSYHNRMRIKRAYKELTVSTR